MIRDPFNNARQENSVLLIDDDTILLRLLSDLLEQFGFEVEAFASGVQALSSVRDGAVFDVLLTDVLLSENLNGVELARQIKAECPDISIIFTTGGANIEALEIDFPGSHFLPKPSTPDQIVATIEKAMTSGDAV